MNNDFSITQYEGTLDERLLERRLELPIVYRLTGQNIRAYYTRDKNQITGIYTSGTTVIKNLPDPQAPINIGKWERGLVIDGKDPKKVLQEYADFGTASHVTYADIQHGEVFDFDNSKEHLFTKALKGGVPYDRAENLTKTRLREYEKDVAAYMQFIKTYNAKSLGSELMLTTYGLPVIPIEGSIIAREVLPKKTEDFIATQYWNKYPIRCYRHKDTYRVVVFDLLSYEFDLEGNKLRWGSVFKLEIASAIDDIMEIDEGVVTYKSGVNKGKVKSKGEGRLVVIVDNKTGKKGFYKSHIAQLFLYRILVEHNFPDLKIDGIYNYAPKDWTGDVPTFHFTDQERDVKQVSNVQRRMASTFDQGMADFEDYKNSFAKRVFVGSVDVGNIPEEGYVKKFGLYEYIEHDFQKRFVQAKDKMEEFLHSNKLLSMKDMTNYFTQLSEEEVKKFAQEFLVPYISREQFLELLIERLQGYGTASKDEGIS